MAGDWIPFECATLEKPEVYKLARMLGVSKGDALLLLLTFWVWADTNLSNGKSNALVTQDVDNMMHCPGFGNAMKAVGWLEIDDEKQHMSIPGFGLHHGKNAKKRLLASRRQADLRQRNSNAASVTKALTREEKRKRTSKTPAGAANGSDPRKKLFDLGVSLLTSHGVAESSARSFLGFYAKQDERKLTELLGYLAANPKVEPKAYIVEAMKPKPKRVAL